MPFVFSNCVLLANQEFTVVLLFQACFGQLWSKPRLWGSPSTQGGERWHIFSPLKLPPFSLTTSLSSKPGQTAQKYLTACNKTFQDEALEKFEIHIQNGIQSENVVSNSCL